MIPLKLRILALLAALILPAAIFLAPTVSGLSEAERFALRVDAALDRLEEPEFVAFDLASAWPFEIAPYFEYEGLTNEPTSIPEVIFDPQLEGAGHNHLLGYTYCEDQVFLNLRFINWVSPWYDRVDSLATLVHEMVHTLGGGFCEPFGERTETVTQLGTLEVLAGMANHGNEAALYALLDELRGIAMGAALSEALEDGDLDRYRDLHEQIFDGDPVRLARFEKSMRYWEKDMGTLKNILSQYDRAVFEDFVHDYRFKVMLPGDTHSSVVEMDDLQYVLEELL